MPRETWHASDKPLHARDISTWQPIFTLARVFLSRLPLSGKRDYSYSLYNDVVLWWCIRLTESFRDSFTPGYIGRPPAPKLAQLTLTPRPTMALTLALLSMSGDSKRGEMTPIPPSLWDLAINPLSPNSDKHLFSPYNITTWSNTLDMRMKELITKDETSWCSANSLN